MNKLSLSGHLSDCNRIVETVIVAVNKEIEIYINLYLKTGIPTYIQRHINRNISLRVLLIWHRLDLVILHSLHKSTEPYNIDIPLCSIIFTGE